MTRNVQDELREIVTGHPVVLFMKGSPSFPQCGFSATVVQILSGLLGEYHSINVLSDPEIRQGIKTFSDWPTIPQLYVNGEFVGGCDIVREMHKSGDLQSLLGIDTSNIEAPEVHVSEAARKVLSEALAESESGDVVHLAIDAKFRADLHVAPRGASDLDAKGAGVALVVDLASAKRAQGVTIDFVEESGRAGFKIDNPNAPAEVAQLNAEQLKAMLDSGEIKELFDVRTPQEIETASIGGRHLDDAAMSYIEGLPKDTPIAFYCHVGGRSQSAAEHFKAKGFTRLFNLAGGIDAWSQLVDPSVPRY